MGKKPYSPPLNEAELKPISPRASGYGNFSALPPVNNSGPKRFWPELDTKQFHPVKTPKVEF